VAEGAAAFAATRSPELFNADSSPVLSAFSSVVFGAQPPDRCAGAVTKLSPDRHEGSEDLRNLDERRIGRPQETLIRCRAGEVEQLDVFALREQLVRDYRHYAESFLTIKDERIRAHVTRELDEGLLWPDPPLQLNPAFEPGGYIEELVADGTLHEECESIFRTGKRPGSEPTGERLRLHRHQAEAIHAARAGRNYVLTTGTGSGKSLSYIVPIVDHVLRTKQGSRDRRVRAIVVYPMNALANSQAGELEKFLCHGYPDGNGPVTFRRFTGQESEEEKQAIRQAPPDILLTNYVMLEYILTRPNDRRLVEGAEGLAFLVLDELHTYRGRQGADVALLARRVRDACRSPEMRCVGTSATLAGPGTFAEQRAEVARVASRLFGAPVAPEAVIGETLRPATRAVDPADPAFLAALSERVRTGTPPATYQETVADPLACWIERTLGIAFNERDQRYERCRPRALRGADGAAALLAAATGLDEPSCLHTLEDALLAGSRVRGPAGFPVFAFRLHQFFSGGSNVSASVDVEDGRYITTSGQQFVPGDRSRVLLPLAFCRECGQEYYSVREHDGVHYEAREVSDRSHGAEERNGYLYFSNTEPWPDELAEQLDRVPADWLEPDVRRIKRSRRDGLPQPVTVDPGGRRSPDGLAGHFLPAPFRFCLHCGVAYGARQIADFGKLSTLGAGGRSTSTTVLALSAVRQLREDTELAAYARKLLSFSDNRQDASLQAGHFNDFVEIGLLRSALHRAAAEAGPEGLTHDVLAQRLFDALHLDFGLYAAEPDLRGPARERTNEVLREVLAYRVYRDQRRGWRLTSPNLEQTGLLRITYDGLAECCADEEVWSDDLPAWCARDDADRGAHPALTTAEPEHRLQVAQVLLDYMRRELAIKVDALEEAKQEQLRQRSSQRLIAPWAIDEFETLVYSSTLYPQPRGGDDDRSGVYLSPRGGFGLFLRRHGTFPLHRQPIRLDETERVIGGLIEALRRYGLIEVVAAPRDDRAVPGFRLQAAQMRWLAGDGSSARHDPIRVPQAPAVGARTNRFFADLYREIADGGQGIEAREHTAQVKPEERENREDAFRAGTLPLLFCSPTMELGVDIASLNVVNLRNVPPTPANYAQRSGRAGRSGQPALVYTFCSSWNSHDQYFFRRPERMVAGQVAPPQLDLANEDLVRAHVHAIWLAESGIDLGKALTNLLDVDGEEPTLELRPGVRTDLEYAPARERARFRATGVLAAIGPELEQADWYDDAWLGRVFDGVAQRFDRACDRWRGLYRSALATIATQTAVVTDASKSLAHKNEAKRLRREAEAQLELLTAASGNQQSDFHSHRYMASEGFLPGYNFPRLPLSAFIPGRRVRHDSRDEFLQRPRFLAITEFGPRSIVYHEGARYIVNKVILPIPTGPDQETLPTERAKLCGRCGYLHAIPAGGGPEMCERCSARLPHAYADLLRLQNVATRRRDRISSDEEERQRQGFEVLTAVRFGPSRHTGEVRAREDALATLDYGQAATIWRVNLGWSRRADRDQRGFVLDTQRGYWARNDQAVADDPDDPLSGSTRRVIPFVEDHRNSLLFDPGGELSPEQMASLQAALKRGIQAVFQLEEAELAAEPLPSRDDRRLLMFFEAAEGGAGVLRRLLADPAKLAEVAREALAICHFDPNGIDQLHAPHATERCEAACYDCLLSYGNQRDHKLLDRQGIRDVLLNLASATVRAGAGGRPHDEHLELLLAGCESQLERRFLHLLTEQGRRLPDHAQRFIANVQARPDFEYRSDQVAVFIDGPIHDDPDQQREDAEVDARLDDHGYEVVRFHHAADWGPILDRYPGVFGGNGT
jgi:superfamily II DNA/RNA helicase